MSRNKCKLKMENKNKKFVCLENNMVSLIKEKINFAPFMIILDDINAENIAKLKLAYVGGFNFVCSVTPKHRVLV